VAAGIEADRMEDRSGAKITFRKIPKNDPANPTGEEKPTGKGKARGNTGTDDPTSNPTTGSNPTSNPTRKAADRAECGDSGDSGDRSGTSWENDPMRSYRSKRGASE
jgi:hypothetical protein